MLYALFSNLVTCEIAPNMQHNPNLSHPRATAYLLPDSAKGYTQLMLELYDLLILRLSSTMIWRCPTSDLVLLYSHHLSRRHLELGVGTGYLLQHGVFPSHSVKLLLLDCNPRVLRYALRRLARYQPLGLVKDLTQPDWAHDLPKQQSIGLNYVWHALQGTVEQRSQLFAQAAQVLTVDGVLFGATIRGMHPRMSKLACYASQRWLAAGLFNNRPDTSESLHTCLSQYFAEVQVWLRGEVMLFVAKYPKSVTPSPC